MLCPNCGTRGSSEHKFCRRCGMNLEPITQALAEHRATGGAVLTREEEERRALARLASGMTWGLVLFFVGLLLLAVAKMFALGRFGMLAGLLVTLVGGLVATIAAFAPMRAAAGSARALKNPDALPDAKTTGRLLDEPPHEPLPTITDRTTELLKSRDK